MKRPLLEIWNMCGKKRAFKSERAAKQHAARFPVRVYPCPICHRWHTTKLRAREASGVGAQNNVAPPADLE